MGVCPGFAQGFAQEARRVSPRAEDHAKQSFQPREKLASRELVDGDSACIGEPRKSAINANAITITILCFASLCSSWLLMTLILHAKVSHKHRAGFVVGKESVCGRAPSYNLGLGD